MPTSNLEVSNNPVAPKLISTKQKILVINNLAGIWAHNALLTKLVAQFDPLKTEITTLACGGKLTGVCTVMESKKRGPETNQIVRKFDCCDCNFSAKLSNLSLSSKKLVSGPTVFLSNFLSEEIREKLELTLKIYDGKLDNIFDKKVDGIEFARISIYETLLKFKKKDASLSEIENKHFRDSLRNSLLTYFLAEKFFKQNQDFDSVYAFSPQYSITRAITIAAEKFKMRVCFVDGSSNIAERNSGVALWDLTKFGASNPAESMWPGYQNIKNNHENIFRISEHINQLRQGRSFSVYSEPYKSNLPISAIFGIPQNHNIATLVLSSTDEVFAAKFSRLRSGDRFPGKVFQSQQDWVRETINWFEGKEGLSLIIRMHPREMPSRRNPVKSQQSFSWEELGKNLPTNVYFNHPSQKIPIKSILEASKVVLTGWSSVGIEALLEGVPVITYDSTLPGYPRELQCSGNSVEEYLQNLQKFEAGTLPKMPWQEMAMAWLSHLLNDGTIYLSGRLFENRRKNGPPIFDKALNAIDLFFPFVIRPIEAWITFRPSRERERIRKFEEERLSSLYD